MLPRKSKRSGNWRTILLIGVGLFFGCGLLSRLAPAQQIQTEALAPRLVPTFTNTPLPMVAPTVEFTPTPEMARLLVATNTPAALPTTPPTSALPPLPLPTATSMPMPTDTPIPVAAPVVSGPAIALLVIENAGSNEILGIRNDGGTAVQIGGWRLTGSKGDDFCEMPGGTTLQPGETYQVATGASQPGSPGYKCGDKSIWSNDGETITLIMPDGVIQIEAR